MTVSRKEIIVMASLAKFDFFFFLCKFLSLQCTIISIKISTFKCYTSATPKKNNFLQSSIQLKQGSATLGTHASCEGLTNGTTGSELIGEGALKN